ncbi:hypothetical protein KEM56_005588 [Ascosphaera pollenicola]|nr:hypothetical protein KEM56_005588 [Ascosphaera pollenicola]
MSTPVDLNVLFAAGAQSRSSPATSQQQQQQQQQQRQDYPGVAPQAPPGFPGAATPTHFPSPFNFHAVSPMIPPHHPAYAPPAGLGVWNQDGGMMPGPMPSFPGAIHDVPASVTGITQHPAAPMQPQPRDPSGANELMNLLKRSSTPNESAYPVHRDSLNFRDQAVVASSRQQSATHSAGPGVKTYSTQDLLASLYGKPAQSAQRSSAAATPDASLPMQASPDRVQSAASSDMLLKLFNTSKPSPSATSEAPSTIAPGAAPIAVAPSNDAENGNAEKKDHTDSVEPVTAESSAQDHEHSDGQDSGNKSSSNKTTLFTYVNPFDQLAAVAAQDKKEASAKNSPNLRANGSSISSTQAVSPAISTGKENQKPAHPSSKKGSDVSSPVVTSANVSVTARESTTQNGEANMKEKVDYRGQRVDVTGVANNGSVEEVSVKVETSVESQSSANIKAFDKEAAATIQVKKEPRQAPSEVPSHWEPEFEPESVVPVYNFPYRPFLTITWKGITSKAAPTVRADSVLDIARLKKEFDQLDRQLVSATSEFVAYPSAKTGVRIIRQSDGADVHLFKLPVDRMIHVNICSTSAVLTPTQEQNVMAVGASGTTYWAPILSGKERSDMFTKEHLDARTLVFPPSPVVDENPSGGQNPLRTRAKRSSRHPEFFGIMRGRYVHIVFPFAALSTDEYFVEPGSRRLDTARFYKEQCFKIPTGGKPGRDFTFSDDDSVVVTLDRSGRMRFWDISPVLENLSKDRLTPKASLPETPVCHLVMAAGTPGEKCSPASILFVDKLRPYYRGGPCRYVLAGLKQNHVLQLWDLSIGKAVQEFVLPQSTETDAICSVSYHPQSGVIIVGHPTRNVIYFIQLSVPKYDVPPMTQAEYCRAVSEKSNTLPKPESTAFMSCIREMSYEDRGQLRSLDVLSVPPFPGEKITNVNDDKDAKAADKANLQPVFEVYTMYHRGVNCITITKDDLGLGHDDRVILPHPSAWSPESVQQQGSSAPQTPHGTQPAKKEAAAGGTVPEMPIIAENPVEGATSPVKTTGRRKAAGESESAGTSATPGLTSSHETDKQRSRRRRQRSTTSNAAESSANAGSSKQNASAVTPAVPAANLANLASSVDKSAQKNSSPLAAINFGVPSELLNREAKRMEQLIAGELSKSLKGELDNLYSKFSEDRIAQDKASTAKQDAALQAVSRTLSDGLEQSLTRAVEGSIKSQVLPKLMDVTAKNLEKKLQDIIKTTLPNALSSPTVLNALSSRITTNFNKTIETTVNKVTVANLLPTLKAETSQAMNVVAKETESRFADQVRELEAQRQQDSKKIEELTDLVRSLSQTVTLMAQGQTKFQGEILQLQQHQSSARIAPVPASTPSTVTTPAHVQAEQPVVSLEDREIAEIDQLMKAGKYEEGSIRWLQSSQQANIFDRLFVNYSTNYLSSLSPIVALSVGAAVTSSFETNVMQRLDWLQSAFKTIDPRDPDIREVVPRIMETIVERLENLRSRTKKRNPSDPVLRRIPPLVMWAKDLRKV